MGSKVVYFFFAMCYSSSLGSHYGLLFYMHSSITGVATITYFSNSRVTTTAYFVNAKFNNSRDYGELRHM